MKLFRAAPTSFFSSAWDLQVVADWAEALNAASDKIAARRTALIVTSWGKMPHATSIAHPWRRRGIFHPFTGPIGLFNVAERAHEGATVRQALAAALCRVSIGAVVNGADPGPSGEGGATFAPGVCRGQTWAGEVSWKRA